MSALLIKFPGTNCDVETARALSQLGVDSEVLPVAALDVQALEGRKLVVFCGGFSYGDYVMSGRFAQLELESRLGDALKQWVAAGGYVLGICNGFQILSRIGLLPEGSLIHNESGRYQCQWTGLVQNPSTQKAGVVQPSPVLKYLPRKFEIPMAHAEGRFVAPEGQAERYVAEGSAALFYQDNVNGSTLKIAAMQDQTGRVFGLMPHPERFMHADEHYDPDWQGAEEDPERGWGWWFFKGLTEALAR